MLPREKLKKFGVSNLTDIELISVIIRTGTKGESNQKIAARILKRKTLSTLEYTTISELMGVEGIGYAKASSILASIELGVRIKKERALLQKQYIKPSDFESQLEEYKRQRKEHVVGFYLNGRSILVHKELLFLGSFDAVDIKAVDVFELAIKHRASRVIIAHNHPSGNSSPSFNDMEVTKDLLKAGQLLGITLLDHLIVAEDGLFSFKAEGLLKSTD